MVFNERVEFNPPLEVSADGTVSVDRDVVQWEGKFWGSERFSGDWTAGDCEGSWDVTGEKDGDFGGFVPED